MGGVPTFELNVPIVHAGRVIAVADVLWRKLHAVLEIDSREYHLSEAQWKATMARHNKLTNVGYAVTHYPPSAIREGGLAGLPRSMTGCAAAPSNSVARDRVILDLGLDSNRKSKIMPKRRGAGGGLGKRSWRDTRRDGSRVWRGRAPRRSRRAAHTQCPVNAARPRSALPHS